MNPSFQKSDIHWLRYGVFSESGHENRQKTMWLFPKNRIPQKLVLSDLAAKNCNNSAKYGPISKMLHFYES